MREELKRWSSPCPSFAEVECREQLEVDRLAERMAELAVRMGQGRSPCTQAASPHHPHPDRKRLVAGMVVETVAEGMVVVEGMAAEAVAGPAHKAEAARWSRRRVAEPRFAEAKS